VVTLNTMRDPADRGEQSKPIKAMAFIDVCHTVDRPLWDVSFLGAMMHCCTPIYGKHLYKYSMNS